MIKAWRNLNEINMYQILGNMTISWPQRCLS